MSRIPSVVVFYDTRPVGGTDPGDLLLRLAAAAWRYERRTTLLVDADPNARITRQAHLHVGKRYLPPTGGEPTLDEHLDAMAELEPPLTFTPWRLSRRARSLIPGGGDALGAHARALGAVVSTGGALDLCDRISELLCPLDQSISLTLVLAPPPGGGLGSLLGSRANQIVLLGDDLEGMIPALGAIDRACRAADPLGPDELVPVVFGPRLARARLKDGLPERHAPVFLNDPEDDASLRRLLRALPLPPDLVEVAEVLD